MLLKIALLTSIVVLKMFKHPFLLKNATLSRQGQKQVAKKRRNSPLVSSQPHSKGTSHPLELQRRKINPRRISARNSPWIHTILRIKVKWTRVRIWSSISWPMTLSACHRSRTWKSQKLKVKVNHFIEVNWRHRKVIMTMLTTARY